MKYIDHTAKQLLYDVDRFREAVLEGIKDEDTREQIETELANIEIMMEEANAIRQLYFAMKKSTSMDDAGLATTLVGA